MGHDLSDAVWRIVRCPACGGELRPRGREAACAGCGALFPRHESLDVLDLRLPAAKSYPYVFELGTPLRPDEHLDFAPLPTAAAPAVDYSRFRVPSHLSRELLSHFPKARRAGSPMLDLGCGSAVHRAVCEHAGFEYVGLDYESGDASLLGDAHALPFADDSFEFVLSVAVLEHLRFPFVMMKEVHRVLQPGGRFIGTVAFLEPFHQDSIYHHTHLGTVNSLREGGFAIAHVSPSARWSVLLAQARMALFPAMPRPLQRLLVLPLQLLHEAWWGIARALTGRAAESTRMRITSGAFAFVASKPPAAPAAGSAPSRA